MTAHVASHIDRWSFSQFNFLFFFRSFQSFWVFCFCFFSRVSLGRSDNRQRHAEVNVMNIWPRRSTLHVRFGSSGVTKCSPRSVICSWRSARVYPGSIEMEAIPVIRRCWDSQNSKGTKRKEIGGSTLGALRRFSLHSWQSWARVWKWHILAWRDGKKNNVLIWLATTL